MYGHFYIIFRHFIIERQGGEPVWEKISSQARCDHDFDDHFVYDEEFSERLISFATEILGLPQEPLLEMLGEYYLTFLRNNGHDEMLRNLGSNVLEFLQNLDSVHAFAKRDYPEMVAPSFRCDEDSAADRMVLHYYSCRKGLHSVVKGLIVEAAKAFFKMQLQMDVLSIENENVAEVRGDREHVTFNIIAKKISTTEPQEGPPTFIAQTKKHSERQILQEDVEAVKEKLEQIKRELGEGGLPLMKKKSPKAKWRIAARITALHRGFVPNYPQTLPINPRMFIEIFPYHLVFDPDMRVVQSGIKVQFLMPGIRNMRSAIMTDFFSIKYPNCVDLTYKNIERFILCPFILEFKKEKMEKTDKIPILLKGQMFQLRDNGFFVFIASPVTHSWLDLEHRKLKLADIPMWDVTRDFLVSDHEYRKCLDSTIRSATMDEDGEISDKIRKPTSRHGSVDLPVSRDRLHRLQRELDNERHKNEVLYQTFLPKDVVDHLQRGQVPQGEFHQQVTALFCDVVHFLPIVAKCNPNDVVGMLNSLQARFDKITRVHGTYKVESIGDAYLVIAGVGDKKEMHADRIANTALGMLLTSREVTSPLDDEHIKVRIGVHSGSVVTGVIGHRIPRFVVMGETSVVASKLESHGEEGRIHVSPTTFKLLEEKPFTFVSRGEIELRGYGSLETYFLTGNEVASDDDLLGRPKYGHQDITYINEGKMDATPFEKRNKVYPAYESPSSGVGSRPPTGESDFVAFQYK